MKSLKLLSIFGAGLISLAVANPAWSQGKYSTARLADLIKRTAQKSDFTSSFRRYVKEVFPKKGGEIFVAYYDWAPFNKNNGEDVVKLTRQYGEVRQEVSDKGIDDIPNGCYPEGTDCQKTLKNLTKIAIDTLEEERKKSREMTLEEAEKIRSKYTRKNSN